MPLTAEDEVRVNDIVKGVIKPGLPLLVTRYMPWISSIPLKQGITWVPTWNLDPQLECV